MEFHDLGILDYRAAWAEQERAHDAVVAGAAERVLLVEHPAVITFGRRAGIERHLLASEGVLKQRGVEVVQSDRGGDITFHGPGQLVVYPIVRLIDHKLSVGGYVHLLEDVVVKTLNDFGITSAHRDPAAVGVWVHPNDDPSAPAAKVCAIGVRIRRGVSMHGFALNVSTDLSFFDLIVPCGLPEKQVTSLQKLLGKQAPALHLVKEKLGAYLMRALETV